MIEKIRNGLDYRLKGWQDIAVLISCVGLVVGIIQWGLKLDDRQTSQNIRLSKAEKAIDEGILPLADERFRELARRLKELESDFDDHEDIKQHPRMRE